MKILILLSYFMIIFILYILAISLLYFIFSGLGQDVIDYFNCEAMGYNSSQPCADAIGQIFASLNVFNIIGILLEVTFPLANLVYVINEGRAKKVILEIKNKTLIGCH